MVMLSQAQGDRQKLAKQLGISPHHLSYVTHLNRIKKNHELFEIKVDEEAAKVVQKIFELYTRKGYGSKRICFYLTEQGINSRAGKNFVNCTIQRILQNDAYLGTLKNGEARSDIIRELQIIDEHTFELAQKISAQRSGEYAEHHIPLNAKGSTTLLDGNIFCGHCGARLVLSTSGKKYHRKDGGITITPKIRYVCYNKTRHRGIVTDKRVTPRLSWMRLWTNWCCKSLSR